MQHVMRIQKPTLGDEEVKWDPAKPETVEIARKAFDLALGEKKKAFKIEREPSGQAKPGEPITEFDPNLGEILFVPAHAGG